MRVVCLLAVAVCCVLPVVVSEGESSKFIDALNPTTAGGGALAGPGAIFPPGIFSPFQPIATNPTSSGLNFGGMWGFGLPYPAAIPAKKVPPPVIPQPVVKEMANVNMNADEIRVWCEASIKHVSELRLSLIKPLIPHNITKAEVLSVMNDLDVALGNTAMLASLLTEVHPDAQIRNESSNCELRAKSEGSKLGLDRELYEVVLAVSNETARSALDDRRFEKLLRSFRRGGVTLSSEDKRKRVQQLNEEIDLLASSYSQNVNADTKYITRFLNDTAALRGLPADFISSHTKNDSVVVISTDNPDMQAVLKYAVDATLRKDLHIAYHNRASPGNLDILAQVLSKRFELAQVLNYPTYAHYAMEEMMIGSPDKANAFTRSVANATKQRSLEEINELLLVKQDAEPLSSQFFGYDSAIYTDKLTRTRYGIGADEIKPYFRYQNSRDGVIAIASRMYGLRFDRLIDAVAWHKDVEVYDVYWKAAPGLLVGRVYLDMHPRANKYKHAAQFPIRNGVRGVQVPEGALVCNFGYDDMEHSSVVTLFHEFGHLMHHLLGGADAKYADFSGVATEWDFVEAPSQMFEEWAFDLETLQSFAVHNDTKEPIPADLVQRLSTARLFGRSMLAQQQMFYAQISLQFHMLPPSSFNASELFSQIQAEFSPYAAVPGTNMLASFGHLMGYSSNYYTYMWSQSIAQHMLKTFKDSGSLLNPHVCLRYRDHVLSAGGKKPAAVLVYDFTEQPFSLDAFNTYLTQRP